jgi:phage terminase large subunit-like protein
VPFSDAKASRAINFCHGVLRRPDDAEQPYRLVPWMFEITRDVYGTVDLHGRRQYRTVYIEIPKKNGKSEYAAANGLYLACERPTAKVYSAASSVKQTKSVWEPAASMVENSPLLNQEFRVLKATRIISSRGNPLQNYLSFLSADGDKTDGIKTDGVIADELHRWRERKALELWGVLEGGKLASEEPLSWIITTAGEVDESPLCWQLHEYARAVLRGDIVDPTFYARIFAADVHDDWEQPATWRKANPSLEPDSEEKRERIIAAGLQPGFLRLEALAAEYRKAQHVPEERIKFKRLHLNLWDTKADEECPYPLETWKTGGPAGVDLRPLLERRCYAGLDLSSTLDLTSLTLHFPDEDGTVDVLSFSWLPEQTLRKRQQNDKVPYASWASTPQHVPMMSRDSMKTDWPVLDVTPGNAIDYEAIKRRLREVRELFDLQEVGFDRRFAAQMSMQLTDEGFRMIEVPQTATVINEPFQKSLELVATGRVRHGNNPLLNWTLSCARVKTLDDNLARLKKPDRAKDSKRIDPIAAWLDALFCAMRFDTGPSIYETRGVAFTR